MAANRFGSGFPRLFAAAFLQEASFALLIHLPGYMSKLGATEGVIGVLYASSAVASLLFRPALGRILDLTRRRTVLLFAGASNAAVILALITTEAWSPYLWALFLVQRTLQIALFATMLTYAADAIPRERRTQGLAIFGLSGLIPIGVGGYLGDVIIDLGGFHALFLVAASASMASWLIVWTFRVLPILSRRPRRGFWAAFSQRDLLPIWFMVLIFSVGLESLFTFMRTYVAARQVGTAGMFFAAYGAAAVITRVFGGPRYDRVPHRLVLVSAMALYGTGLGLLAVAGTEWVLILAGVASGAAHGAAFPIFSSQVVMRARVAERGSAMSIFTSIFDIALLTGTPAVGFLIEGFSYLVAFSVAGLAMITGALAYLVWDRRLVGSAAGVEEVLE